MKLFFSFFIYLTIAVAYSQSDKMVNKNYHLIAHRGGIVDSMHSENSLPALKAAIRKGYSMVEIDLRLTKDSVLIVHHDPTFKRYYGVDRPVTSMTWKEVRKLRSSHGGSAVLKFEDALKACKKGGIQVMLDNKIKGVDTVLFTKILDLLKSYDLLDGALMIGTAESTPFFTGKIKLNANRKEIEANSTKPGYSPDNYYFFVRPEYLTSEDIKWANDQGIRVVGIINGFLYARSPNPGEDIGRDTQMMIENGITWFQLDSAYDAPFMNF